MTGQKNKLKLVVVDNAWMFIGEIDARESGEDLTIRNGYNVRSFGRGKGMAAFKIARDSVVLDKMPGTFTIEQKRTVFISDLPDSFKI